MSRPTVATLAKDIEHIEDRIDKMSDLIEKLDYTIDKLHDITNDLFEKRRDEMEEKTELLHYRISSGEKEMQEKLDTRAEVILQELKQMREESAKQHEALNSRIVILERWMWVVLGAFAVLEIFSFDLSSLI